MSGNHHGGGSSIPSAKTTANPATAVESAQSDLTRIQAHLRASLTALADRLSPALSNAEPEALRDVGRDTGASPLVESIRQHADATTEMLDLVNSLHARLTL